MMTSARTLFLAALLTLSPALATALRGLYEGTVIDWPPGQTGEVRLLLPDETDVARGPIDADGHFSLTLPVSKDMPDLYQQKVPGSTLPSLDKLFLPTSNINRDCHSDGTGTVTPSGAHYQFLALTAFVDGEALGELTLTNSASALAPMTVGKMVSKFLFIDAPVVIEGNVNCVGSNEIIQFHGPFPAGWSLPLYETLPSPNGIPTTWAVSSKALPAQLAWRLYTEYSGIGLSFDVTADRQHGLPIKTVVAGQPAEAAGVLVGDLLVEVDGKTVVGLPISAVLGLVRGPAGVTVTLGVVRGGGSEIKRITITRALLRSLNH